MKRKLTFALFLLLAIGLFGSVFTAHAVDYHEFDPHAPYFINRWETQGLFDALTVDWYCDIDATDTYWACHSFGLRNPAWTITAHGYAGFQNVTGSKKLLMSCWNISPQIKPKIEFIRGGFYGYFDGEGEGQQIYTNFRWKPKTWYTMRIQVRDTEDKTIIEQWVRSKDEDWILCSMISYLIPGLRLYAPGSFQEDFAFNNLKRKQRLKNFYGHSVYDHQWYNLATQKMTTWYYESDPSKTNVNYFDLHDTTFNCDWGVKKDYLWIETGGGDYTPNGKYLPDYLAIEQPALPEDTNFFDAESQLKRIIKSGLKNKSINAGIEWTQSENHYDILSLDVYSKTDAPSTIYRTQSWDFGSSYFKTDAKGDHSVVLDLDIQKATPPKSCWVNKKYKNEITEERNSLRIETYYPWQTKIWYTVRIQTWTANNVTYVGQWISEDNNVFELVAVASYKTRGLKFQNPQSSFETGHNHAAVREMRMRNAYARTSHKKKWKHWPKYTVKPYYAANSGELLYLSDFEIETKRKGGSVRIKIGGKKIEGNDRSYPFTFRIPDEDAKPNPAKFITIGLPDEIRP